jgi:hypothetical protein
MPQSGLLASFQDIGEFQGLGESATLAVAKVTKIHPEANLIDIILFDGTRYVRVPVMTTFASSRTGCVNLPISEQETPIDISYSSGGKQFPLKPGNVNESDVYAIIGFISGLYIKPICLGFLFPEENELLCSTKQTGNSDGSQYLWKHTSNTYVRVDEYGDIEISHPSGVFIKVGNNAERTDIVNYDKNVRPFKWKNKKTNELSPAPYITITHPSGNYWTVDPQGNVKEYIVGNVDRIIKGNLNETIEGDVVIDAKKKVSETSEDEWAKESKTKITDKAPDIQHNE